MEKQMQAFIFYSKVDNKMKNPCLPIWVTQLPMFNEVRASLDSTSKKISIITDETGQKKTVKTDSKLNSGRMKSKYYSTLKISLTFFIVSSFYIVLSGIK